MKETDISFRKVLPSAFEPESRHTDSPSLAWLSAILRLRRRDDDDDDPPPCPAVIAPSPRLPPFGAEVELEAA